MLPRCVLIIASSPRSAAAAAIVARPPTSIIEEQPQVWWYRSFSRPGLLCTPRFDSRVDSRASKNLRRTTPSDFLCDCVSVALPYTRRQHIMACIDTA